LEAIKVSLQPSDKTQKKSFQLFVRRWRQEDEFAVFFPPHAVWHEHMEVRAGCKALLNH
jgi:hypothetical protein